MTQFNGQLNNKTNYQRIGWGNTDDWLRKIKLFDYFFENVGRMTDKIQISISLENFTYVKDLDMLCNNIQVKKTSPNIAWKKLKLPKSL